MMVSPSGRVYGAIRDVHRRDDEYFRARVPSFRLPESTNNRAFLGPVKDQESEGCCVGESFVGIGEWVDRKYLGKSRIFSPQFTYCEGLIASQSFPKDTGLMPRVGADMLIEFGLLEESLMPFVAGQIVRPTQTQEAAAATDKFGGRHRVNSLADLLSALADPVPWVAELAFEVYQSFESQAVAQTGIMPIPNVNREMYMGGHSVIAVDYDLGKQAVLCRNSWNQSWGQDGNFWMPFAVVQDPNLVTDMWIVHPGHWGK